jgi:hypothetical protein
MYRFEVKRLDGEALREMLTTSIECLESKQCSPAKHHYNECVERVTGADHSKAHDKKHPDEDCVEECKAFNINFAVSET